MKGLLQSKRFRDNLRKWLLMYIGVMMLFTTVVTYSKYISSFSARSEARIAKFKVDIDFEGHEGCRISNDNNCAVSSTLPLNQAYTFKIDQSKIEVYTELTVTAGIPDNTNYYIKEIIITDEDGKTIATAENPSKDKRYVSVTKYVQVTDLSTLHYKLIVSHIDSEQDYEYKESENYSIYVGYSAEQQI